MYSVIKPDGSTFQPKPERRQGPPPKYPWRFLEIGDAFEVPHIELGSVRAIISQGRNFGRDHEILRSANPGHSIIKRTT